VFNDLQIYNSGVKEKDFFLLMNCQCEKIKTFEIRYISQVDKLKSDKFLFQNEIEVFNFKTK